MSSTESEPEAGHGVSQEIPDEITTESVWKVLLIKIKEPNLILPVTDVSWRISDDGLGIYREMSSGPRRVRENIYSDENMHEVIFKLIDEPDEIVNLISTHPETGKRSLEFFRRNSTTKERVHWAVSAKLPLGGISKVLEMSKQSS